MGCAQVAHPLAPPPPAPQVLQKRSLCFSKTHSDLQPAASAQCHDGVQRHPTRPHNVRHGETLSKAVTLGWCTASCMTTTGGLRSGKAYESAGLGDGRRATNSLCANRSTDAPASLLQRCGQWEDPRQERLFSCLRNLGFESGALYEADVHKINKKRCSNLPLLVCMRLFMLLTDPVCGAQHGCARSARQQPRHDMFPNLN